MIETQTRKSDTPMPGNGHDDFAVVIEDLMLAFGDKQVLDGVNLTVNKGSILALMGPSGCGKSTLLKVIAGLLPYKQGKMELFTKKTAMSFQQGALFTSMTVAENIDLVLQHNTSLKADERKKCIDKVLSLVGLDGEQESYPGELSGGMIKRAGIARALSIEPDLVLHDEPSMGLDPILSRKLNDDLHEISRTLGVTTLMVTHDLDSARSIADRIALLWQGQIRFEGKADEFFTTDNDYAVQFRECSEKGPMSLINNKKR